MGTFGQPARRNRGFSCVSARIRSPWTDTPPTPKISIGANPNDNKPSTNVVRSPVVRSIDVIFEFRPKHAAPPNTHAFPRWPDSVTIIVPSDVNATPCGLSRCVATTVQGDVVG